MSYLKGFDFVNYLKKHFHVGQIDPWRRHDNGDPVLCLITSVEISLEECKLWSNQDITRSEFVKYLQENNIFVFRAIEEFQKYKGKKIDETKLELRKKTISEERRKILQEQAKKMRSLKHTTNKPSVSQNPL